MVIVDGYNAVRRIPSLATAEKKAGLAAGRRALVSSILASGVLQRERVLIVFDAFSETVPSEPSPHPMLGIRFSAPPQDADATIVELLSKAGVSEAKSITVVTADSELSWQSRRLGASVVPPEKWRPFHPRSKGRKRPSVAPPADKPEASARDVDYWLGVFGEAGDPEDPERGGD